MIRSNQGQKSKLGHHPYQILTACLRCIEHGGSLDFKNKEVWVMKSANVIPKIIFVSLLVSLIGAGIAAAASVLKLANANESEVVGTFSVVLYASGPSDGLQTLAILDRQDDAYTFEPYAPAFDYTVKKGLSAKEALETAQAFVRGSAAFQRAQLSSIRDSSGTLLGFEVRPLYYSHIYGMSDVLDVSYEIMDKTVRVYIRLQQSVERQMRTNGGDHE